MTSGFARGYIENPKATVLVFREHSCIKQQVVFDSVVNQTPRTSYIHYGLNKSVGVLKITGIYFQWVLGSYLALYWNYADSFDGVSDF